MSKEKRPVGRPSELNADVIECAWAYVKGGFRDVPNLIPSIAGLAFVLGKSRECMYEWARQNNEFSDILSAIQITQEMMLIDGGLSGDFNATITKMMMTKHGYSDKVENEVSGSLNMNIDRPLSDLFEEE
ncbi:DNA-packaging protein [Wielerella bovis]|uniref:DNA-packaging protein n=1 Tax=Wielerella bovis TaxID=2917790 RepID=UPI002019D26A|nr:DNA-packaging protein [Wielerella bovis]ULJ60787.1 DNA-packaging protein [Wielerella bovis]ULJ64046.1 DNA-packaging protein [Wielerella bovis]ULJ67491.1 DNA-packaging protein [Wielerella bovis]